ncbi:response regulator transcription factor [Burkholderia gladioli]|uniref:Two component transcriptional regulator, winged helix family protein n=1 Tax=Burkholderia gladioli (strain BSR3) TaxID=999541 RepID=F2LRP4_BURGS|nr:response regulator transcription factor [Burkholderia gladioli]AEA65538.1 two component transcriptional regulator, winged helix family protein [Burkholderia gladioli BSR3]MBW5286666.1 response regulator transcription factor [Burkholderia gladioli]
MTAAHPDYASAMRIAVLEDNTAQAKVLATWIENAGYHAVVKDDGDRFLELVEHEKFDMLLLDWDVPGTPGIDVLKRVRARLQYALPIVMITQYDDARDIVHGLDQGADDYIVKPLEERVLLARIAAQLRKYYPKLQTPERLVCGDYVLDPASFRVTWRGDEQPKLQQREFDLAYCLFKNVGSIVKKDVLRRFTEAEQDETVSSLKDESDALKAELDALDVEDDQRRKRSAYLMARIKELDALLAERKRDLGRKQDVLLATYISRLRSKLQLRAQKSGMVITTVYSYGYRLERASDSAR